MFKLNIHSFSNYIVKNCFSQIKSLQTKSIASILDLQLEPQESNENNDSVLIKDVRVVAWVKSFRDQKEIKFMHLNDGSDSRNLQSVILIDQFKNTSKNKDLIKLFSSIHFNTSVEVIGDLVKSTHKKQLYELRVNEMNVIRECESSNYPFQFRSSYNFEQLRQHIPMRSHTSLFASVMRFRSQLIMSFHDYLHKNSFIQVHTPILTSNNCEGGCETFQVNINDKDKGLDSLKDSSDVKNELNKSLLEDTNSDAKQFFLKPVYLTASAQLHLETMTSTLSKVYTMSPTFRAEKSLTRHHLAEFYMLEIELIDMNDLGQLLDVVELLIKNVSLDVYNKFNKHDLNLILNETSKRPKNNKSHMEFVIDKLNTKKFIRVTYKEAIEILNKLIRNDSKNKKLNLTKKTELKFGDDINKEQEKLLVEYFDHIPVFVTNYPKLMKPFYMRQNDHDPNLVDNFDLLAPFVGEIVGGSNREYRLDLLSQSIEKQNLDSRLFRDYLNSKKYGGMKLGGFGIGLERFIQFLLNIENIRDTCSFPRSLYNCKM